MSLSPPSAHGSAARLLSPLVMAAALALSSCAPGPRALPDTAEQTYTLGVGDQIRVITFADEQLTGQFRISDTGTIALPLLGNVPAAGLSASALSDRIAAALVERRLLKNPSVSVEILAYRPIYILGEVVKPGQYPYQPGMTMLTAVAVAGGFTYRAVQDEAPVIRTTNNVASKGLAKPMTFLRPGDVITIPERLF